MLLPPLYDLLPQCVALLFFVFQIFHFAHQDQDLVPFLCRTFGLWFFLQILQGAEPQPDLIFVDFFRYFDLFQQIARQRAEMEVLSKEIDNYIAQNGSSKGEEVPEEYLVNRKSAGLIWPVPYGNTAITCHFGYYSNGQPHYGTDIVVRDANGNNISNGKSIVAAQSGKVIRAMNNGGYNSGYGNYCIIDHGNGMLTLYAHCRTLTVYEG